MKLWIAAISIPLMAMVAPSHAELVVSGGVDHVNWGGNGSESDGGNIIGASVGYTQDAPTGTLFAYRGRLTLGETDYVGSDAATGASIGGTSKQLMVGNEVQVRKRSSYEKDHVMDIVLGAGWEHWNRKIPVTLEKRTYDTIYMRLGIEFDTESRKEGWIGGFGLKYPLTSRVKRDFSSQGLATNPTLKPGRDFSSYIQLGYRFDPNWSVLWYFDGFRFRASDAVDAPGTSTGTLTQEKLNVNITGIRVQYSF
jgi:hypothetical protein